MHKEFSKVLAGFRHFVGRMHPAKLVLFGYAWYIVLGWLFLSLPIAQQGPGTKAIDNLFIATSAVSTTGLTPISITDDYTWFGQLVVLILIQVGGVGYMTFGSFIILARKQALPLTQSKIGKTVFSLPGSFDLGHFIRCVIAFTILIESVGAVVLFFIFRAAGQPDAVWSAVFHSVSSFCTAGFSIYNNSLEGFSGNFWLTVTIATMSYLGAIGFIVFLDFWNMLTGRTQSITLTSKIILWTTFWMSCTGTFLLFIGEPSLWAKPLDERILTAFFQAMSAMTTVGFNTVGIGALSKSSALLLIILMVIGSSPSGTGGGLKCTTFSAFIGVMRSAIRGEQEVRFWNRPVPMERVWTAVGSVGFYLSALVIGTYLMEMTETSPFDQNFFEVASALGTVGLSMGVTPSLSNIGKLIIVLLMFCGRLGPLTFGMALFGGPNTDDGKQDNDLAV